MTEVVVTIDLRKLLGAARDQGPRPTCLVFAMSDGHTAARKDLIELSSEYLYYQALAISGGSRLRGASIAAACKALDSIGQPEESEWPYIFVEPQELPEDWRPPSNIKALYQCTARESAGDCSILKSAIEAGDPTVAIIFLSRSFFRPQRDGIVELSTGENPMTNAVHAVLVVGLGTICGEPAFLIRNSWGTSWGMDGHAWISEHNLTRLLIAAIEFGDVNNVPNDPTAV